MLPTRLAEDGSTIQIKSTLCSLIMTSSKWTSVIFGQSNKKQNFLLSKRKK